MKSTSSGSGLRSVLAIASTPRSATSRRRISASISFLNCSMRISYSSLLEPLLERRQLAADLLAAGLHQLLEHRRRGRGSAACGTGSTCRRPAGPAPCRRSAARPGGPGPASAPRRRSSAPGSAARPAPRASASPSPRRPRPCPRPGASAPASRATSRRARRRRRRCCTPGRAGRSRPRTPSRTPASARCSSPASPPSAYLNASRSSSGMCCTASIASRFSVSYTGSPASRSSSMNPASSSSIGRRLARRRSRRHGSLRPRRVELLGRLGDVGLVLEQDVERLLGRAARRSCSMPSSTQRAGPVERLATPTAPSSARAGGSSARCGRSGRPGCR